MPRYSWSSCPADVRRQVEVLLAAFQEKLAEHLTGVYLHGSLAMGCFNPARSDLDLLVVIRQPMAVETKRAISGSLLRLSRQPAPVEISFLSQDDLTPWRHPTPFDLHYSETWRERYTRDLASGAWQRWNEERKTDADLAAHLTITRARGICLLGQPICEVLPAIPPTDYLVSILADVEDFFAGRIAPAKDPVYFVLNACRVLAYVIERHICSKDEGGAWALSALPAEFHEPIAQALAGYQEEEETPFAADALERFAAYMQERLKQVIDGQAQEQDQGR